MISYGYSSDPSDKERARALQQIAKKSQDVCGRCPQIGDPPNIVGNGPQAFLALLGDRISYDQFSLLPAGVLVSWNGQTLLVNFNIKMPLS